MRLYCPLKGIPPNLKEKEGFNMKLQKSLLGGVVCSALLASIVFPSVAATANYNDGATVGGSDEWAAWVQEWDDVATDYTKVSLTPGADETELNFAWYSLDNGEDATPVVHFGTDRNNLETYTGTAGDVETDLTGGVAYDYNYVTVTGLERQHHLLLHRGEERRADRGGDLQDRQLSTL